MGFADEMKAHDEEWEEAQAAPRKGRLPDGPHQAILVEARIEEKDGKFSFMLKWQNQAGSVRKWNNLDHEVGRSIGAQDAAMLGYTGKLSGLEEWLMTEEAIGTVCEIKVATQPGTGDRDFTRVYLNRVLGKGSIDDFGGVEAGSSGTGDMDDDIPF